MGSCCIAQGAQPGAQWWPRGVGWGKWEEVPQEGQYMEKAMAPHSSTLAWKTPWTEEPGGLQSMRLLRVGHDWVTSLSLFPFMHWRRQWQPTPVFLPGESQGRGSLVSCCLWGHTVGHDWSDLVAAAAAWLVYFVAQQKPTQHCKAIILQLKTSKNILW